MLDIYVPGHKRTDAPLIKKLIEAAIPFTIVLDHKDDFDEYARLASDDTRIMRVDRALGIGYVRQKIKDRYRGVPLIMLDDDTELRLRDVYQPTKTPECKTPSSVRTWFGIIDRFCRQNRFDIGSAADFVWKWSDTERVLRVGSCCSVTIFNSARCREVDYDPALYARMEDWDIIMQGITRKFDFLLCNEALRHCPMNKGAKDKGGCSAVYKNDAVMFRTHSYLQNKWGADIVSFVKNRKIGNAPDFRVDLKALRKRYGYDY